MWHWRRLSAVEPNPPDRCSSLVCVWRQGRIQGGRLGRSFPVKPTKAILFTIILYNSQNYIRDVRPLCRPLFCHSNVVKYIHLFYSSEAVVRLDYHRRRQWGPKGPCPPPIFLEHIVILCFERRFSKQNSVVRLKSNIFASQFLG